MTKRKLNGQMSEQELLTRRFHSDVRKIKNACEKQDVTIYDFSTAPEDSICVISSDEYELCAVRRYIFVDNESYFVEEDDYDKVGDIL